MATKSIPTKTEAPAQELVTKKEVAKRLKLCKRMIEIMVNDGRIPAIKIGRSVRFNWNAVLEALESVPT